MSARSIERRRKGLAALLLGIGTLHFLTPRFFDELIPGALPGTARAWTYGSGVAELTAAPVWLRALHLPLEIAQSPECTVSARARLPAILPAHAARGAAHVLGHVLHRTAGILLLIRASALLSILLTLSALPAFFLTTLLLLPAPLLLKLP